MKTRPKDVFYLDKEGHYGNAEGLVLIDVAGMNDEVRAEFERSFDEPNGIRVFLYEKWETGEITSVSYSVLGTGIVLSEGLIERSEPTLREFGLIEDE